MAKDLCETCGLEEPARKGGKKGRKKVQSVGWICCDSCYKWFHTVCIRASNIPLQDIVNYWYFCEKCSILGTLVQKQTPPSSDAANCDIAKINDTICELSSKLERLQIELETGHSTCKKPRKT